MTEATDDDKQSANGRVAQALTEALDAAVNGAQGTGAIATSAVVIVEYDNGELTTRIAGLINKNHLYGALREAEFSIHEIEKALNRAEDNARDIAMVEKYMTDVRSDN